MPLESYREKRDFGRTPEPEAQLAASEGRLYVIQKHAASRLHYDFRLELDGVLLSWAVPKGPSLDPHDKHLAVRVEDHPVAYGGFEGVIPKGEYGGGTVEVWDRGTWEPVGDPHEALARGDMKFLLHGDKLHGSWVLARMKGRAGEEKRENWLLIKHRDEYAVDGDGSAILADAPASAATGRTVEEIAADADRVWHSSLPDLASLPGARRATAVPRFVEPELCTLVSSAPEGDGWLHEIKLDGYRAIARVERRAVSMLSRRDKDWTDEFRSVADALAALPLTSAVLDGEVVVQGSDGTTSFHELVTDLGTGRTDRLSYYVFDVLYLDGFDLTDVPLTRRKEVLRVILPQDGSTGHIRYTEDVRGDGSSFHAEACRLGVEGMVSKRADSPYRPGRRGGEWLKVKCLLRQEFVIGGWTDPGGSRTDFGALLLGVHDHAGSRGLRYVGKVGTGFDDRMLREIGGRLHDLATGESPFTGDTERVPRGAHFVEPQLVCEVAFIEWTGMGGLRHPSFKGLREDKPAADVVAEVVAGAGSVAERRASGGRREGGGAGDATGGGAGDTTGGGAGDTAPGEDPRHPTRSRTPTGGSGQARAGSAAPRILGIALTHPDRLLWPDDGVTKRDLAAYYERVAEHMLPYVVHRPIAMLRCPEGVEAAAGDRARPGDRAHPGVVPCFFHKHAGPDFPGPFERITVQESGGPGDYLAVTEPASLVALAQMGVLEIHVWGSTTADIEHPDVMVFDLDPDPGVAWRDLVEAATLVRTLLDGLGLVSFVKTTGGKGLHVVVPLRPREDWHGVGAFARAVAEGVVSVAPDRFTSKMAKAKRAGKVFVDYLRNARSATAVAPFSTRARPGATVSVPLRWDELAAQRAPVHTIRTVGRRLAALGSDPWEGYLSAGQTITATMKREIGLV